MCVPCPAGRPAQRVDTSVAALALQHSARVGGWAWLDRVGISAGFGDGSSLALVLVLDHSGAAQLGTLGPHATAGDAERAANRLVDEPITTRLASPTRTP